jgi:hypothetical protein
MTPDETTNQHKHHTRWEAIAAVIRSAVVDKRGLDVHYKETLADSREVEIMVQTEESEKRKTRLSRSKKNKRSRLSNSDEAAVLEEI